MKTVLFICQVPHLQIMDLEGKEQMFTMGDQDLDMGEDINIGGLQIIRFEFFLFCKLPYIPMSNRCIC